MLAAAVQQGRLSVPVIPFLNQAAGRTSPDGNWSDSTAHRSMS